MSEPWPFGTVVKISHRGLLDVSMIDLPTVTKSRLMVVSDKGVQSFWAVTLVETPNFLAGEYTIIWARQFWEPVDE